MEYNSAVEDFQGIEYPILQEKTYLDHGGTTIYAKSFIEAYSADLVSNLYGNPHSASAPAKISSHMVDYTREQALRFFGADPEHFDLIFVANATAAIKLVMESFRDLSTADGAADPGFWYGYHVDAHNSLIGVRECSDTHHLFRTDLDVDAWLTSGPLLSPSLNPTGKLGLFAYPGQSNMTGRRLPLRWASQLRRSTNPTHNDTYSLLDAAALATTAPLHSVFADPDAAPDFTAISFYKIFGFPDLGGLIVRKASGKILCCRRYFGGGTVSLVTVQGGQPWHETNEVLHESLEDGTLPFHSIIALKVAMATHERLYGGSDCMQIISKHTTFLAKRLYDALVGLRHPNGAPVCQLYVGGGGESAYGDSKMQGPTISFNVRREDGTYVPYTSGVEAAANKKNIFVRSGQLCNPGGVSVYLGIEKWQFQRLWAYGHRCGGHVRSGTEVYRGKPTGVVRASIGAMTTMANIDDLISFLRAEFVIERPVATRPLTLEEGIALVIRDKDESFFSDASEKEYESEEEQSKAEVRSYRVGTRSHRSSIMTTRINVTSPAKDVDRSTPIVEERERRRPVVHVISVQEFEMSRSMSRSKAVYRPTKRVSRSPKKEVALRLKRLLSPRASVRSAPTALVTPATPTTTGE